MEEPEMQLKVKKVTDKFTESLYVLANEPSVALFRLQEHVRRSLPELAQHKSDMQSWEEQSQGAIYTVEYACRVNFLEFQTGKQQDPENEDPGKSW
uniref:BLOC-1 related complex subunit 8 n=1 Tax=Zosterops lateralis melanops TaxID=1220523 RepID=A0A8D2PK17_ZOSLA